MTRTIRLRDGADPELRELMRYAQERGVPADARIDALTARVLSELAAPATEPASASHSAGSLRPLGVKLPWLIGMALSLTIGGISAYRGLQRAPREPSAREAPRNPPVLAPPPISPPRAKVPAAGAAPHEEPTAPPNTTRTRARTHVERTDPPRSAPRAPATRGDQSSEIVLLQRARSVVASNPEAALALLAQHGREHATGVFSEEREALAVEALWRAGSEQKAQARLRALLAAYPRSTYRDRLTTLLAHPLEPAEQGELEHDRP